MTADPTIKTNLQSLKRCHGHVINRLELADSATNVQTKFSDIRGRKVFKVKQGQGNWTTLHSPTHPQAEASRWVDKLLDGQDSKEKRILVVLGFGLGYHLEALTDVIGLETEILVVEPELVIFKAALADRDLTRLIQQPNLHLCIGRNSDEIMRTLAQLQLAHGFPLTQVAIHEPSVRAMPGLYRPVRNRLTSTVKLDIGHKLKYAKFGKDNLKILVLESGYFLTAEVKRAFNELGHVTRDVFLADRSIGSDEFVAGIIQQIVEFQPDFIFTVNHLGFDRHGVLSDLLARLNLPTASWHVDTPRVTLRDCGGNVSDWTTVLVVDDDHVAEVKSLGYERVQLLPLGTDHTVFKPMPQKGTLGYDLTFVASSLTQTIDGKIDELKLPHDAMVMIEQAAGLFAKSGQSYSLKFLEQTGFMEHSLSKKLNMGQWNHLEGIVIQKATQQHRLDCVMCLADLKPVIFGDKGWASMINGSGIKILPPVNYYRQLPNIYQQTKINLNVTSLQMPTAVNQRVFDVPACGGFLLTDHRDQLDRFFDLTSEIAVYSQPEEGLEMAKYYLAHSEERNRIADRAHQRVIAEHTYLQRVGRLIQIMTENYG